MKAYIDDSKVTVSTLELACIQFANAEDRGVGPVERDQIRQTVYGLATRLPSDKKIREIATNAKQRVAGASAKQRASLARAAEPIVSAIRSQIAAMPGSHRGFRPSPTEIEKAILEAYPDIPAADRAEIAKMI